MRALDRGVASRPSQPSRAARYGLAVAAVVVAAIGVWFANLARHAGQVGRPTGPRVARPARSVEPRAVELEPAAPLATAREIWGDAAEAAPAASSSSDEPAMLRVEGVLLDSAAEAPIAGARVSLRVPRAGRAAAEAGATTELDGRFALDLPAAGTRLFTVSWADVEGPAGERLFSGSVLLQPEMLLLARDQRMLRGRFVAELPLDFASMGVRVDLPPQGTLASAIFAGSGPLDAEGRFAIPAATDLPTGEMLVLLSARDGNVACASVATEDLVSAEGAVIPLDLGLLEVRVVDPAGLPLAGAEVRLSSSALASAALPAIARTDAAGRVRLPVARSTLELVVSLPGYAFVHRELDGSMGGERVERVELRPLFPEEAIGGRALAAGRPVADVLVTAFANAENPETGGGAFVQGKTDADGRFRLNVAGDGPLRVAAYQRERGLSEEVIAWPGDTAIELVFEPKGSVRAQLAGLPTGTPVRSGPVQVLLLSRTREWSSSGHDWSLPVEIDEVPPGSYNLYVNATGLGLFGQAALEVEAGATTEVEVLARQAFWIAGRVVDAAGAPSVGTRVVLRRSAWPDAFVEAWGSALTGSTGSFRVFAGTQPAANVLVEGRSYRVEVGGRNEIALP